MVRLIFIVMFGLDPNIQVLKEAILLTWMLGSSPSMTA